MFQKNSNEQELNVLLISNEEKSHYVCIKDFNRLMHPQVKTKNQRKKYFCMSCLQNFTTKEILNNHRERCLLINDTPVVKCETGACETEELPRKECFYSSINDGEGDNDNGNISNEKYLSLTNGQNLVLILLEIFITII